MARARWIALVGCLLPLTAHAQAIDGGGGFLVADYRNSTLQPVGWFLSISARPVGSSWFAVAAEVSGEYSSERVVTVDVHRRGFAALTGARVIGHTPIKTAFFVETLLGIAHDREFLPARSSLNHFVWQPGAGADVELADHVAARFHVAYRLSDRLIASRFAAGLVVKSKSTKAQKAK